MVRNRGRRGIRRASGLGELPPQHYRAGPINDPGAGLIPEWINNATQTNFPFVIGLASEQIIPSNPLRTYVIIQNKDPASNMFVNFGNSATVFNGVLIIPLGNYELIGGANNGAHCPNDSIHILGAAAGMVGVISEGVLPPVMPGG